MAKTEAQKAANRAAVKRFRKSHPEWWKWMCWKGRLKREYGMTEQDFKSLLVKQNYCCAVCRRPLIEGPDTVVDHRHGHKRPRGLVHRKCNTLLGNAEDNAIILRLAAEYLEAYEKEHGG